MHKFMSVSIRREYSTVWCFIC